MNEQLLTSEQRLDAARIDMPPAGTHTTSHLAAKAVRAAAEAPPSFDR